MKISKNPDITNYIKSLIDINDLNISLSEMFLSIIGNPGIYHPSEIRTLSKRFNRSYKDIIFDKVLDFWGIDSEAEDNQEILSKYVYPSFSELDLEEYLANPYYQNIKIKDVKMKGYSLINDRYQPFELFASDDIKVDQDYIEHTSIGFFNKEIPFIALNQNNVTWMSVNPNEIKTMQPFIDKTFGDVVVFGLGLGYFPYMISLKENVKSITIIEKDPEIINIFNQYLLPQFPHQEKIKIIKTDAFEYAKSPIKCDYAFVDLWHNAEDGLNLYIKFKNIEDKNPNVQFGYWLEDSFYALLRRAFISLLYEQAEGYKEDKYQNAETEFDRVINRYYSHTKNLSVSSIEEIKLLLTDSKLLELYR